MNTTAYHPIFEPIVKAALSTPFENEIGYSLEFARFSTTLYQCRPEIPLANHGQIYQYTCAQQALAIAEEGCDWWGSTLRSLPLPSKLLSQPGIIATYHTGSYRLLPRWLHSQGLPFSLVVSRAVGQRQGAHYRELADCSSPDHFDIIDAEQPNALFVMRKALRSGKYLLVYVDGNTGVLPASNRNTAVVPFFDTRISVRAGIAHLAYLAGAPIYPITHHVQGGVSTPFCMDETLFADPGVPRRAQASEIMHTLYSFLERMIQVSPAHWEGWFYLNQHMLAEETLHRQLSPIGHAAWMDVEIGKRAFRVDRKTGACFPVAGSFAP